ncbi:hypothetical protein IAI18_21405 [Acetobacteraceae bacterium H6797]|nr:hypothetical protein [Acetobacteraceae bacterium H6797]
MSRLLIVLAAASMLGGCVVAPPPARPAGVVYVAPSYPMPAPGYEWRYHAYYGWGWWHPHYGWHRGWR